MTTEESFLKKLKERKHEPLRVPAVRRRGSLTPRIVGYVLLLVATISAAGTGWYYTHPEEATRANISPQTLRAKIGEVWPFGNGETQTTQHPEPGDTSGEAPNVSAPSRITLGEEVELSYELSSESSTAILFLHDTDGNRVGVIGEVEAGQSPYTWNPQILVRSGEGNSEIVQAPQPGEYRVLIAQGAGESMSGVVAIAYDRIANAQPFAFGNCAASANSYSGNDWYGDMSAKAAARSVALSAITRMCISEEGRVAVFIIPAADEMNYPAIYRFNMETSDLHKAVYTGERSQLAGSALDFGVRDGDTIPVVRDGAPVFSYNYLNNTFIDAQL
ncbi:MAG: hypothetical protein WD850_02295 [Candidatus Spechtbacterales bacterium]